MTQQELIINVATGEETYVDLTPEKIAALDAMHQAEEERKAAEAAAAEAKLAAKASAEAKLAALGLTPEEIKAL